MQCCLIHNFYANGNFIDPIMLADYSVSNGHRVNGVGTAFSLYSGAKI